MRSWACLVPMAGVLVWALVGPCGLAQDLNYRPVIGILAQEPSRSMLRVDTLSNHTSYIAASYVKFIEGAGARVVPILIDQSDEYYDLILSSVNGVVFPGGSASITNRSGYGRAGERIYDHITTSDLTYPLLGVCLGFEMLMYLAAGTNPLTKCRDTNRADPLELQSDWNASLVLGGASDQVLNTLTTTNATSNFHKYCVTPQTFQELQLDQQFHLLSTSYDDDNVEYVSTVEHKTLPLFGTQWHPEKNLYEWQYDSIPHTREAIEAAQHFANVFVQEARKNHQKFPSEEEEIQHLIYNYAPTYVANLYRSSFEQVYMFN